MTGKSIDNTLIDEIVRRVLSVAKPDKIIMFGSAVTGEMTPDSDVDLLVLDDRTEDRRRESVIIGDALRGLGWPFDVMVVSTDWFEASKNTIGSITYPAHKYGKVIYNSR